MLSKLICRWEKVKIPYQVNILQSWYNWSSVDVLVYWSVTLNFIYCIFWLVIASFIMITSLAYWSFLDSNPFPHTTILQQTFLKTLSKTYWNSVNERTTSYIKLKTLWQNEKIACFEQINFLHLPQCFQKSAAIVASVCG